MASACQAFPGAAARMRVRQEAQGRRAGSMAARSPAAGTAIRMAAAVPSAPQRVLLLQLSLGNRSVARLVQSKRLTIRPGLGGTVQLRATPEPAREQTEPVIVSGPRPTGSPVQPAESQKETLRRRSTEWSTKDSTPIPSSANQRAPKYVRASPPTRRRSKSKARQT